MCHGRQVLMRDARGVYAATPLFPLCYRLVDLLRHRQVHFSQGPQHVFYDMKGLLSESMDIKFTDIYEDAVAGFIHHASDVFKAEVIHLAITHAEAQYFSLRVNATEETKQGRTTHTVPIVRENLENVTVLLLKPTVEMVVRAHDEGIEQEKVCSFEIEGVYTLPATNRG